jgi:hypothetical protein
MAPKNAFLPKSDDAHPTPEHVRNAVRTYVSHYVPKIPKLS